MKIKKTDLEKGKYVISKRPSGGDVTKAKDMSDFINEKYKDDMEGRANAIAEVSYKTLSWCVVEHNLFKPEEKKELWKELMDMDAPDIGKIQTDLKKLVGGDVEKKRSK